MEHNFGHGHHGLTNVLLTMNLIAFCFHTMSVLNQYIYYAGWEQLLHRISHPRAPP